jgi:hypothetical protein
MKPTVLLSLLLAGCASLPGLKVARSLTDKNLASKPAQVQVTMPRDQHTSYAVDLGVGYTKTIVPGGTNARAQLDLTSGAEYHRNTLADKQQDTTLLSVGGDAQVGELTNGFAVWFPGVAAKFKKDRIKTTESILPTLSLTLASKPLRIGELIGIHTSVPWEWQPSVAIEEEHDTRAPAGKPRGRVDRSSEELDLNFYPLFRLVKTRVELALTGRAWQDFAKSRSLDTGSDRHYLRKASLTYYLDEPRRFGIGIDRVSGENPSEGQPNQHYTQLTLKIAIK